MKHLSVSATQAKMNTLGERLMTLYACDSIDAIMKIGPVIARIRNEHKLQNNPQPVFLITNWITLHDDEVIDTFKKAYVRKYKCPDVFVCPGKDLKYFNEGYGAGCCAVKSTFDSNTPVVHIRIPLFDEAPLCR